MKTTTNDQATQDGRAMIVSDPVSYFDLLIKGTEGTIPFTKANIAQDLESLWKNGVLLPSQSALIVGTDCPNALAPNYPWRTLLSSMMDAGCNIEYLLVDGTHAAIAALNELNSCRRSGSLQVFSPKRTRDHSEEAAGYLKEWETQHFIVFENPRQLWVEGRHRRGETTADACAFFPTVAASKPGLLDVLKDQFEFVKSEACEPIRP